MLKRNPISNHHVMIDYRRDCCDRIEEYDFFYHMVMGDLIKNPNSEESQKKINRINNIRDFTIMLERANEGYLEVLNWFDTATSGYAIDLYGKEIQNTQSLLDLYINFIEARVKEFCDDFPEFKSYFFCETE
jgi:hypothetical protein